MLKLNLIAFTILSVTATTALAGHPAPSQSIPVSIPIVKPSWYVGATALYLKPDLGGNNLGYSSFGNYGTDFNNIVVERNGAPNDLSIITPDRKWGFQLTAGYEFCAGNDVEINWYHLYNRTDGNLPNETLFSGSASALYAGELDLKVYWDAVNLEVGQRFNLNPNNVLRLNAGLSYGKIKNTIVNYPKLTSNGNPVFITHDTVQYMGFGPRISGDYLFQTTYGIGIFAKAGASLLVGTAKQSVTGYHDLGGFNLYSTGNYHQSNNNIVVPELDANLGLKYDYTPCGYGTYSFNLGYMFTTYLNALVSQVGDGVVSSSISSSTSTNFNINGPYFGVTFTA